MRDLGKLVLFILVLIFGTTPFVLAQESVWITYDSNLRALPNTQSAILITIPADTQIIVSETVSGELVSQSGHTSDQWLHTNYNGSEGYVWSGNARFSQPDSDYPTQICVNCNYNELVINSMQWIGDGDEVDIYNTDEVISLLYTVYGRSLWVGYDAGGFSLPNDAKLKYFLIFEVAENDLGGPLLYGGTLYDDLVVYDDQIQVWFWYSQNLDEYYVYVFKSMTTTCVPNGDHCGQHLNGVYAIPTSEMQRIKDIVTE